MNNTIISAFEVSLVYFKDYILIPVDSDYNERNNKYGKIQYNNGLICSYPDKIKISDWHKHNIKISDYYLLKRLD